MTDQADRRTNWRAVAALGLGAFAIVSAEFLPVGMLADVSSDLRVTLGAASAIVLVPGLVAGLAAPVVVTLVRGLDRRRLVLALTALLVLSDVITWLAPDFAVLLAARVLVGLALGGFWAVGPSLGVRLATPEQAKVATSIVLAGISAGTVLGLPIGQVVAALSGWRTVFIGAAVVGAIVLVLQLVWLPSIATASRVTASDLVDVVRRTNSRAVLIVTAIGFTAQLMVQTYISIYLTRIGTLTPEGSSVVLLVYGVVGLVGNLIAPRVRMSLPRLYAVTAALVGVVFLVMPFLAGRSWLAIAFVVVWGLLWGGIPFMLQTWTISPTPEEPEAGSAVLVTFLQLSIALGSTLGGVVLTLGGLSGILVVAGALQLIGAAFALAPSVATRARRGRTATSSS
ncbi:MFS transporter [Curtobacterium pusillum]|uniref:MFS transporter n=1 Tax=Curtobacterium pusillum TaxID=69373 RepID=UPI0011A252A7|nr:MFS transporter [Curtobacterium pusillum]